MNKINIGRRDDIDGYYKLAVTIDRVRVLLLTVAITTTFLSFYSSKIGIINEGIIKTIYISSAWTYYVVVQAIKYWFIPRAESLRRTQMLSDAFGVPLCHEKTALYYNNEFPASISRLGANIMENALFTKSIVAEMFGRNTICTCAYIFTWITILVIRHKSLDLIILVTQLFFSYEIIAQWIKLMFLKNQCEQIYKGLYSLFLNNAAADTPTANASILDYFSKYETAKSTAGVLLSTKIFLGLNQDLSDKWAQIQIELKMGLRKKDDVD